MKYEVRKQKPSPGIVPQYTLHRIGLLGVEESYYGLPYDVRRGYWSTGEKTYFDHFSDVQNIIKSNNLFPYETIEEQEDVMRYEIYRYANLYTLYRINGIGFKTPWEDNLKKWSFGTSTYFKSVDEAMKVVRDHKFFPCVVVEGEVLPLEEDEEEKTSTPKPDVPIITFKDLNVGQKYIRFCGSDPSQHYVFRKVNETDAINLTHGCNRFKVLDLEATVIKVQF